MIDRRFILQAILSATAGGLAAGTRAQEGTAESQAEWLLVELARLEARAYSEQGIPMFLALEDLAGTGDDAGPGFDPDAMNASLAAEYRELARILPTLDREMTEFDAATIVELLAERDFLAGGT